MAEEDLVTAAPDSPTAAAESHKRKLEDLEPVTESEPIADPDSAADAATDGEENGGAADESDAKRPRLQSSNGDDTVNQTEDADAGISLNGHEEEQKVDEAEEEEQKVDEAEEEAEQQPESMENTCVPSEADESAKEHVELAADEPTKEPVELTAEEPVTAEEEKNETTAIDDASEPKVKGVEEPSEDQEKAEAESEEHPREGDVPVSLTELQPGSDTQVFSRKIEVPNDKVGVLIGKAGDTIRSLQDNSGAKIQIVRDADADPRAATRPLELVGTLQSINKAERLIKDVIAEADAGGAPSLVARGFTTAQAASIGEQIEIQVPYEKVGLIIGKGGESIRNLQTQSGARIQLIQPSPSHGNRSGERTVRITGNKKQIDNARELIKDVMNQTVRPSHGGYNQQGYRPRGANSPQWGPRGPQPQFPGYNNYRQRGPYPSQGSQYPPPMYGNYPPQHGPRGNFGPPNWEQRPPTSIHGPSSQGNYNYGQQGPDYGNQPPAQPYGHGYNEVKYDNHAPSQPYGHMGSQPAPYAQGGSHPGYGAQDQYGRPPMHGQPAPSQSYIQPRPAQSADPYQGQIPPQPYAQNPPPQQTYPQAPSGQMQQNYPYGPTPTTDGYNHPSTTAPTYPAPVAQPVTGYNQPAAQQPGAYPQAGAAGGYGSYPTAQYGYPEQQSAANTTAYGYQGQADPAYGTSAQGPAPTYPAPAAGQVGYAQAAQTQPAYDQSGGYGNVAAPTVSPLPAPSAAAYPQYDSTGQMYGAHR